MSLHAVIMRGCSAPLHDRVYLGRACWLSGASAGPGSLLLTLCLHPSYMHCMQEASFCNWVLLCGLQLLESFR